MHFIITCKHHRKANGNECIHTTMFSILFGEMLRKLVDLIRLSEVNSLHLTFNTCFYSTCDNLLSSLHVEFTHGVSSGIIFGKKGMKITEYILKQANQMREK